MRFDQMFLFGFIPSVSLDIWTELIVPSLSALLSRTAGEVPSDVTPVAFTIFSNKPVIFMCGCYVRK